LGYASVGAAQNQWNRSARINNKPVAERMFNITTVLLDTFMVCTFGFKDLFKSSPAFRNASAGNMQPANSCESASTSICQQRVQSPFVSVNIARLAVNPALSDFGR
jgi:hypothetical protein